MTLKTYNTLTRQKEVFTPLQKKLVQFFVCGPTVYDNSHIGHAKTYTQFDIIVKYLRFIGFEVVYLQNITDIDDKIISRARERNKSPKALAKEYEEGYRADMSALGNDAVSKFARATEYMDAIIRQIKDLLDKGFAYETSDGVYFEVEKFSEYGKLSHNPLENLKSGARIDVNEEKRHPYDFVLWKKAKPGEPTWESPWGEGRPGWHIEDTAITESEFGPQYDVHGGAVDLIFPHHECEIAQMEGASGKKPLVKYWLHTAFLNINDEKMAKSTGNFLTIKDCLKKWDPKVLRYFFAVNHYRTPINFSEDLLAQSAQAVSRINNFLDELMHKDGAGAAVQEKIDTLMERFLHAMDDDFNTPQAIASVFDFVREANKFDVTKAEATAILTAFKKIDKVFGIMTFPQPVEVPKEVANILKKREFARQEKDFALSDQLRDELRKKGFEVADGPDGQRIKRCERT